MVAFETFYGMLNIEPIIMMRLIVPAASLWQCASLSSIRIKLQGRGYMIAEDDEPAPDVPDRAREKIVRPAGRPDVLSR